MNAIDHAYAKHPSHAQKIGRRKLIDNIIDEQMKLLTEDTEIVILQISGILGTQWGISTVEEYRSKISQLQPGAKCGSIAQVFSTQISIFLEEVDYAFLGLELSMVTDYDIIRFVVSRFIDLINFEKARQKPLDEYMLAVKLQILYDVLMTFTDFRNELEQVQHHKVWYQYIHEPLNYAQAAFVRLIFGKYFEYWDSIKNNLGNLKSDSTDINVMFNLVGVTKSRIIKNAMPDSALSVNQLIPMLQWDKLWDDHGVPRVETRAIMQNFNNDGSKTFQERLDIAMWLSRFPKWLKSFSYFDYETGNEHHSRIEKIRIHNHHVISHLTLPFYNGKVNLKKHPDEVIRETMPNDFLELIERTYNYLNVAFPIPQQINDSLHKHYPNGEVTIIGNAQGLIAEGDRMHNCIGGFDYVHSAKSGEYHFYHFHDCTDDGHGLSVQVYALNDNRPRGAVQEVKGYGNREITADERKLVIQFISNIYRPYMTLTEIEKFVDKNNWRPDYRW